VRYTARVAVGYVGGRLSEEARDSLAAEVGAQLAAHHPGPVDAVTVTIEGHATAVAEATLRGAAPDDLTSPVDALSRLDASVLRALAITGQFEEFDVVRRTVSAHPA
jgi:hypothetical protein